MLNDLLNRLFDIRRGEARRVGAMFALLGLIITVSYILKPVRNSLFLSQYGASYLPYVYIVVAGVVGFVAAVFSKLVSRFYLKNIFFVAALFFAGSLGAFWWAIEVQAPFTGFVFYVWVSIYTIVMPSLFWLIANYIFYSNEARRLFSLVAAGGILGSIAGGGLTSALVSRIGTSGLLLAASVVLVAIGFLGSWVNVQERDRIKERRYDLKRQEMRRLARDSESGLALVARSRYLKFLTLLTVVSIVTSTLVDYQFNSIAEQSFDSMDRLTRFFGAFFATISILAFLIQLFTAGRILGRLGVGAGLIALPLAIFSSSLAFVAFPGLIAAAVIKASDDGLSNSINRSSVEILWLPLPLEVKNRAKAWLDMFVDRVSRGFAGLILLLTTILSLSVTQVSGVVLVLAAFWLVLTVLLRNEYLKAFRSSLARRDIDIAALTADVQDHQSLAVLKQVLSGIDEKQTLYALELLRGTEDESLIELANELTSHKSPSIRAAALRLIGDAPEPPPVENLDELIHDRDPNVWASTLKLLLRRDPQRGQQEIGERLSSGDTSGVHAILDALGDSPDLLEKALDGDYLRRFYRSDIPEERELAARAAGFMGGDPVADDVISELLEDATTPVARTAAVSAGGVQKEAFIPLLIAQLTRPPLRRDARNALARYGQDVVDPVSKLLADERQGLELRRALPRVLAELEEQEIVHLLLARLPDNDPILHFQTIRALGKMRADYPRLRFSRENVDRLLDWEARQYCLSVRYILTISQSPEQPPSSALLVSALEERLELARERVSRLLGLAYSPEDVFTAWNRLVHGRPPVRAAALEFLGNLLEGDHKLKIYPLLEAASWEELDRRARQLFDLPTPTFQETLVQIAEGRDPWLSACALTLVGELDMDVPRARHAVDKALSHPEPMVREAAQTTFGRLSEK
jgi:AAA family ATP:ADP antiporter